MDGTDDIYDLTPAPGTVTEEGTFLNEDSLLKEATAVKLGGNKNMVPDEALSILKDLCDDIDSRMIRIVTGSYVGSGGNTKTLTFDGEVIFLIVTGTWGGYSAPNGNYSMILNPDHGGYGAQASSNGFANGTVTKNGNSITWTAADVLANMSGTVSGITYHYIAFLR